MIDTLPDLERKLRAALRAQILRAREDPVEFVRRVGRQENGQPIHVEPVQAEWHRVLSEHDRVVIFAPVGHGKALDAETEIPTPNGWKRIRDLQPGDLVFNRYGQPTSVTWTSGTYWSDEVYEIEFAKGVKVVADAEHLWVVRQSQSGDVREQVLTTKQIVDTLKFDQGSKAGSPRWRVPVAAPVEYAEQELSVDPYVLGAWLGNGHTGTSYIGVHGEDTDVLDRCIEAEGGMCGKRRTFAGRNYIQQTVGSAPRGTPKPYGWTTLRLRLRTLGVLNDKHIPEVYLRASVEQRRRLLAGLMDTDGYAPMRGRSVEYCTTSERLARGVAELVASLGGTPKILEGVARLNDRDVSPKYRVIWTARECPFLSNRKRAKFYATNGGKQSTHTSIVAIRRVAPRLVCCIAVESECKTYLATRNYVVTHNSNHVVRWRVLWELGRNPNLRVGIISVSKSGVPTKFVSAMRADIESNRWVHLIFPRLRKQTRGQVMWGANGFIVERDLPLPDPSVQMFGLYGKILGSRLDLIIMDDVCDMENTMTETAREKAWEWISGEVLSRLPRHGGRVWAIGHVWHHEDVLNRLSRIEGYVTKTYSAFVRNEHGVEVPLMPRMWTMDELRRREQELGRLASRMLRNVVPRDEHARIRQAGIDKCLMRGRGLSLVDSWNTADSPTFTGVDLSVASGRGDLACIFTITILPDGTRRVLDIRSGRWDGPETLRSIVEVHRKFGSIVMVENNAAQDYMLQFANELTTVPLKKHTTGMNKYDVMFGVESLGVEFDQGKWQIPCDENGQPSGEVAAWLRECLAYTPSDHTGDRLMASWIARECARKSGYGQGGWSYRQDAEMLSIDTLAR